MNKVKEWKVKGEILSISSSKNGYATVRISMTSINALQLVLGDCTIIQREKTIPEKIIEMGKEAIDVLRG